MFLDTNRWVVERAVNNMLLAFTFVPTLPLYRKEGRPARLENIRVRVTARLARLRKRRPRRFHVEAKAVVPN